MMTPILARPPYANLRIALIGFGLVFLGGGLYAAAVGRFKIDPQKTLTGPTARLAGLGVAVAGAVMLGIGLFMTGPIWEQF